MANYGRGGRALTLTLRWRSIFNEIRFYARQRCLLELSDELKEKLKNLGLSISSALQDSHAIIESVASIRDSGYDLFLVLEATIGLSHNKGETTTIPLAETPFRQNPEEIQLNITASDKQFLRAMRIKMDDLNSTEKSGPAGE
jgi:predicted nucleic acid-binding protein